MTEQAVQPVVIGVKETKEGLLAIALLGGFIAQRLKDGAQIEDAVALATKLMGDADFKAKVMAGVEGLDKIPAEVKDLKLAELLEIAQIIPELITAAKGA